MFADTAPVNWDTYLDDSDLEDDETDESDLPGSLTVTSLPDSFDYQEPETPKTEEDITTRLGDADLLTDDEFVRSPDIYWGRVDAESRCRSPAREHLVLRPLRGNLKQVVRALSNPASWMVHSRRERIICSGPSRADLWGAY